MKLRKLGQTLRDASPLLALLAGEIAAVVLYNTGHYDGGSDALIAGLGAYAVVGYYVTRRMGVGQDNSEQTQR